MEVGDKERLWAILRRFGVWVLAAGIFAYLFAVVPLGEVWADLQRVSLGGFLALIIALVTLTSFSDGVSYWLSLLRVSGTHDVRYVDMVRVRVASYVLSVINYAAGQGSMVVLWRRYFGVAVIDGIGAVLVTTAANLLVVCALVGIGMAMGGIPNDAALRTAVIAVLATGPLLLIVVAWRPAFLRRIAFIEPLLRVGLRGSLWIVLARLVHVALWLLGHWGVMRLFGFHVPAAEALARIPLIFLMAALPITPAGLGTSQAAAIFLLAPFSPASTEVARRAAVLAYSLSLQAASMTLQALVGVLFARQILARGRLERRPPEGRE